MSAKVFRPTTRGRKMPTIIVVHGLALSGYNDVRVLQLCRAMAGTGATVVAPHIEGLASCVISFQRIKEVTAAVDAVAAEETLCVRGQRVAVVSACITAGFALLSSTRTNAIGAVLCIGAHASSRHVLAHCIDRHGLGGSMYAVEAALLSSWACDDPELQAIFYTSLKDDHLLVKDTPNELLPEAIKNSPRAGKIYTDLMNKFENVKKALNESYISHREMYESVSPIRHVKELKCKSITLIHSSSDGVIPPIESRLLYESIKKIRPDLTASVKITDLLDHGDKQQLGLYAIPEGLGLVKSLANFSKERGSRS
eukprot:IDg16031t1